VPPFLEQHIRRSISIEVNDSAQVCAALRAFAGLPRLSLEDPALVATALDRTTHGLDFADALHLGRAEDCDAFVTFDQRLIRAAKATGFRNVRAP
jgi:predicted nucleic acid-binding protein